MNSFFQSFFLSVFCLPIFLCADRLSDCLFLFHLKTEDVANWTCIVKLVAWWDWVINSVLFRRSLPN